MSLLEMLSLVSANLLLPVTQKTHALSSKLAPRLVTEKSARMLTVMITPVALPPRITAQLDQQVRQYAHTVMPVTISVEQVTSVNLRLLSQPKDSVLLQIPLALLINNLIAPPTKPALQMVMITLATLSHAQRTLDVLTPTTAPTKHQTESVPLAHRTQIVDLEHVTRQLALPLKVSALPFHALLVELSAMLPLTFAHLLLQEIKFALTVL